MMKKLLSILVALFCYYNCLAQNNDVATLKKLNADWIASYVTKDTATMSRIFADDLVLTNPNGETMHKKDILNALVISGQQCLLSKVDTVDVRLVENVGIINAKITAVFKSNNETVTFRTCYMDIYEKRKGRWYAIAAHVTLLNQ
jgi:ketosteroid isomerase-like protein